MHVVDRRTGIEVIDRDRCLLLLGGDTIGRLGVVAHGAPRIFPVNYALDGDTVVFRTAHGTKLDEGVRAPACFEVDAFDRGARTGWSVLVLGHLEEVTPYQHKVYDRVRALLIDPWAPFEKDHIVRLVPDHISGRKL